MKYQEFNGIRFYQTEDTDYFRHSVKGTTILMHRYVWEFYNCKIPKGYHVHHIDGDKSNNDISNLQLMKGTEHWELHGKILTEEEREWRRQNIIKNAVPKATEWHKSDEGKAWHKAQYERVKDALHRRDEHICQQCGKSFIGTYTSKFCCNACKSAYRRDSGVDNVERVCVMCGKTFITDKNREARCCSRSCRAKYGHMKKEG